MSRRVVQATGLKKANYPIVVPWLSCRIARIAVWNVNYHALPCTSEQDAISVC